MNKKLLRDRYLKQPEVQKYCQLAAKFTLQSPKLAGLQQARQCPAQLSCQDKNASLCMEGLITGIMKIKSLISYPR